MVVYRPLVRVAEMWMQHRVKVGRVPYTSTNFRNFPVIFCIFSMELNIRLNLKIQFFNVIKLISWWDFLQWRQKGGDSGYLLYYINLGSFYMKKSWKYRMSNGLKVCYAWSMDFFWVSDSIVSRLLGLYISLHSQTKPSRWNSYYLSYYR